MREKLTGGEALQDFRYLVARRDVGQDLSSSVVLIIPRRGLAVVAATRRQQAVSAPMNATDAPRGGWDGRRACKMLYAAFCMSLALGSKSATTVVQVAQRLLTVAPGERVPPIGDLSRWIGVGSGTIQSAIQVLREAGTVQLRSHGHLGTTLVDRNLGELWVAAGYGPLEGFLPLPTSMEFAGLATALVEVFSAAGIPMSLSFSQGVRRRFESLERRHTDFVLCSVAAARHLPADEYRVIELPAHTFFAPHAVVVITRAGEKPNPTGRVPIDRNSHDHVALTEAEFPRAHFVDAPYMYVPELVVRGEVDAAVWHRTSTSPLLVATGLSIHSLSRPESADIDEISRAALVTRLDDEARNVVFDTVIEVDSIAAIQSQVLANRKLPAF